MGSVFSAFDNNSVTFWVPLLWAMLWRNKLYGYSSMLVLLRDLLWWWWSLWLCNVLKVLSGNSASVFSPLVDMMEGEKWATIYTHKLSPMLRSCSYYIPVWTRLQESLSCFYVKSIWIPYMLSLYIVVWCLEQLMYLAWKVQQSVDSVKTLSISYPNK